MMAEKGEVLENFCRFTEETIKRSKSKVITPFTTTDVYHEAEKVTCNFEAIEAYWQRNQFLVGEIRPEFKSLGYQNRFSSVLSSMLRGFRSHYGVVSKPISGHSFDFFENFFLGDR